MEPMAVASYTALIGTSDPIEIHDSLDELAQLFAFDKISTAPARFDPEELKALNARLLHKAPFESVAGRLKAMGIEGGPEFWRVVHGNLSVIEDAKLWWGIVSGDVTPVIEDKDLTAQAAVLLPDEPWDDTTWDVWIAALKTACGRKGRALFHPLRLALTGCEDGPELKALLPLIGRAKAEGRLKRPHLLKQRSRRQVTACSPTKSALRMKATAISWPSGNAHSPPRTTRKPSSSKKPIEFSVALTSSAGNPASRASASTWPSRRRPMPAPVNRGRTHA